jgi:alkanesulfonate monooxygenase SsuD/methylene tetrahydromethanopterin reductase-like flavin-dependent oxidoreductase (luciferase family)
VPVAITKNPDTARADTAKNLDFYNQFPSYQRIMAREGVAHAADLAVIGNPDTVISQLLRYRAAGATDLVLSPFQTELSALQLLWAVAAEM